MSNASAKQRNDVNSVESAIDTLLTAGLPIKSLTHINDVDGGEIFGMVDDTDHEQELAAGVSYVVIGLGKLPTSKDRGVHFYVLPKEPK